MAEDGKHLDYLFVLKALDEIPFCVGKKLLIDFLIGERANESVIKNRLYSLKTFGTLGYSKEELGEMINNLVANDLIRFAANNGNKFWKVLELTEKGRNEISNPSLFKKKLSFSFKDRDTEISDDDRKLFAAFADFLSQYNEEQKKAIVSSKKHILCIAGAGSGKTTVLTKRIEFIVRYRSADPERILAVTFTRKARREMMKRLEEIGSMDAVSVETFNSFCEKILRRYNDLIYDSPVRVVSYRDKIMIINRALDSLNLDMKRALEVYFTQNQKRGKTDEQLAAIFLNDCFFIRDYFKFKNRKIEESMFENADYEHRRSARMIFEICNYIERFMADNGLRDFADQLIDTINLFEKHPETIPKFDHVLIDEYQDVNSTQIRLVDILSPPNLFAVGDPRQSIYGWRGSDIKYILNFEDKYPDAEIITLKKNYRSTKPVVDLINAAIKNMSLSDLESAAEGEKDIRLLSFGAESAEYEFVIQRILNAKIPRNEIFVLARTNRQLNELSNMFSLRAIKHIVRSDEIKKSVVAKDDDVTLATVHAIKGLEAEMVFVIGCNGLNFPCKGSEHPVVEMVKVDEYDKEEEERRLLYVAMSRAKKSLYISYSGKKTTHFITDKMLEIIGEKEAKAASFKENLAAGEILARLKEWRRELSKKHGVPGFMILHDKTLIDLTQKMPMTMEDLEEVHGFGPSKIMKYGDEILRIINGES